MSFVINIIAALIVFYYAYRFALSKLMVVKLPWDKGWVYDCNQDLSFLIYSILTAMVFLGPFSLVKYGVWIVLILLMMYRHNFSWRHNKIMVAYTLFVVWNLYTMTYTTYPEQGWMMIIKFCLPYLYFWLGYTAMQSEHDFYTFLEKTCWICCLYGLLLGGVTEKLLPPLYWASCYGGLCITYASLADFFALLITVPVTMYFATGQRKYLWMAAWMFSSSIAAAVRTGIGASVLGIAFFYMIYKKGRSVPYLALAIILFVGSVFAVPEVREKMFGKSADEVTVGTASMDKVEFNGRNYFWENVMNHCYYGKEATGSGCGAALGYFKTTQEGGSALIHSDWVQMLSESGNIGLGFYIFFAVVMLVVLFSDTWRYQHSPTVTFSGGIAIASFAACFFCMGFDNVITYAQQAYVIPFIMLGIFYKMKDLENDNSSNTLIQ